MRAAMGPGIAPFARAVRALFMALAMAVIAPAARGQGVSLMPPGMADSIVVRAQRLASDGNAAAGRALLDSVMAASKDGSAEYVNALFGRAMLAGSGDEARKDYLRIAVDYSSSPRAEDALLRLAQMELARGDRAAAKSYLERLALEHPAGPSRAQGAYWLGRVLIDEGALLPACASLAEAKARVAPSDVELANQIAYYSQPCAAAERAAQHAADSARADSIDKVMRAAKADSIARADSVAKAEAAAKKRSRQLKAASRKPKAVAPVKGAGWSAQVAAYDTPDDARRLAKRLTDRGYDARMTNEKPYRVRIGRYARRDDAAAMVQKLKDAKITAFVVEAEKP
jgi:cell division septation protein DedD